MQKENDSATMGAFGLEITAITLFHLCQSDMPLRTRERSICSGSRTPAKNVVERSSKNLFHTCFDAERQTKRLSAMVAWETFSS